MAIHNFGNNQQIAFEYCTTKIESGKKISYYETYIDNVYVSYIKTIFEDNSKDEQSIYIVDIEKYKNEIIPNGHLDFSLKGGSEYGYPAFNKIEHVIKFISPDFNEGKHIYNIISDDSDNTCRNIISNK